MPIAEQITSYTSWVAQTSYLGYTRVITLKLESGTIVYIGFPQDRPADWLQFPAPGTVSLYMTADQYDDVYHILQTEDPAFCTAIDGSVLGLDCRCRADPSMISASANRRARDTTITAWKRWSSAPASTSPAPSRRKARRHPGPDTTSCP